LVVTAVVALVVFAPEGWYFLNHPGDFVERADAVSVFNENLNQGDAARALIYSGERYLGMFTFGGDPQWDRDIPGRPIFDPLSSVLLGLGLVRLLWDARRSPRAVFVLLWLAIMLVPGILAVRNAPNTLRVTGVIPAIFALPALGADWIWSIWERRARRALRLAPVAMVGLGVVGGGLVTYHDYFDYWARTRSVSETWDADRWTAVDAGQRLAARTGGEVFVGGGDPDGPVQTYALIDDPIEPRVHVFDGLRSLIFPVTDGAVPYVFAQRDLPAPAVLRRYFAGPTSAVSATAPDGDTIRSYTLRPGRGAFDPQHPVAARFGDSIQIYGFDYPTDVSAGATVTIRWYWKIVGPTPRELAFFNQVFDESDTRRGQLDDRAFAPDYWPVGTTGISTFDVPIDPTTPTGPATLVLGVYTRSDLVRLPVLDGNGNVAGSQLTLGPIKVHGQPSPAASVGIAAPAHFADGIDLVGYDVRPSAAPPGSTVTLTLSWSARARPAADYTVFVHVVDSRGKVVAQADAPPRSGRYPTSLWDPGETIVDPHQLALGPSLPPGSYRLEVGLYLPVTGRRLPLIGPDGAKGDRVLLGAIPIR
jgi:hypothetical protein